MQFFASTLRDVDDHAEPAPRRSRPMGWQLLAIAFLLGGCAAGQPTQASRFVLGDPAALRTDVQKLIALQPGLAPSASPAPTATPIPAKGGVVSGVWQFTWVGVGRTEEYLLTCRSDGSVQVATTGGAVLTQEPGAGWSTKGLTFYGYPFMLTPTSGSTPEIYSVQPDGQGGLSGTVVAQVNNRPVTMSVVGTMLSIASAP